MQSRLFFRQVARSVQGASRPQVLGGWTSHERVTVQTKAAIDALNEERRAGSTYPGAARRGPRVKMRPGVRDDAYREWEAVDK